jgi:hypothetical protein
MSEAWKQLDLDGGGLQAANLKLARLLKRRRRAYALLAVFPLGLHRAYLDESRGAWAYRALTLTAVAGLAAGTVWLAGAAALALVAWAAYDLRWIDDRVAEVNKALRRQVYLGQAPGAPAGFRGRYADDAGAVPPVAAERREAPAPGGRVASFAEQEKLLRELARANSRNPPEK